MKKKKNINRPVHPDELMNTLLEAFAEIIHLLEKDHIADSQYYDSADVKRLLNISDSTLFRLRRSQSIPCVKIRKKIFYPKWFFNAALRK